MGKGSSGRFIGTKGSELRGGGNKNFPSDDSQIKHIFREKKGHLPDTPENRTLIENVANNQNNYIGTDRYGTQWYSKTQPDGKQIWVRIYNDRIINAGENETPKIFDPQTGLNNNPLK